MNDGIKYFEEFNPSLANYWRSIILFGRNVASYKFALAKSLIELSQNNKTRISLEELAVPYSRHICEHLKSAPKQSVSRSSKFLESCADFNASKISHDTLIKITKKMGFENVLDAFHVVGKSKVSAKFFEKDFGKEKSIIITDELFSLLTQTGVHPHTGEISGLDLLEEAEARWRLVETAWELNLPKNVINVEYDRASASFFTTQAVSSQYLIEEQEFKRRTITKARPALNGYQKGKCFYCFDDISINSEDPLLADIDHFFPHILQPHVGRVNLDGVFNLVLACKECNRGAQGKFTKVPDRMFLERLSRRNEFLIFSHHPLRETLIKQCGNTFKDRVGVLNTLYNVDLAQFKDRGIFYVPPKAQACF